MRSLLVIASALCAALVAVACEDKPHPWAGKDGLPAVLSPPPPGAAGTAVSAAPGDGVEAPIVVPGAVSTGTSATAAAEDGPAPAGSATSATGAEREPAKSLAEAAVSPGGGWVKCAEGLGSSSDPLKTVTRLGLACGPSNGMRRKTKQAIVGIVGEHEPAVTVGLRVARGACYRIFAVADANVAELDVTVRSSREVAVAQDHAPGRLALVQSDRPFCALADDLFTIEVAARRGSGRFAAEVWSLGEPRRKGEVSEGPADEHPIDKP